MNAWLANHFFNPTFVAGGACLIAAPIIIHLINRMRYKRVRFAAMEFLLASQQRIARADITEMRPGTVSIMPQGLEEVLSRQELADLVSFLKASQR